jgi:hypothetical protein
VVESATRSLQLGLSLRHVTCYCAKLGYDMVTYCATTWALTQKQANRLEVVHSDCLRQILNVRRADRHSKQHLWSQCH